jgi:hypothetical protein
MRWAAVFDDERLERFDPGRPMREDVSAASQSSDNVNDCLCAIVLSQFRGSAAAVGQRREDEMRITP